MQVITYEYAYLPGTITICAECEALSLDGIAPLGAVAHGVHDGRCEYCAKRMRSATLRVGDPVLVRRAFGRAPATEEVVQGIELTEDGSKYGEAVEVARWDRLNGRRAVISFGSHWAYAEQISPVRTARLRAEGTPPCPDCGGEGWVRLPISDHWSSGARDDCPHCDGTGQDPDHESGEDD